MDLPLCKICGDRHRLGGCPQFQGMEADERRKWFKGMSSGAPNRQASESRAGKAQEESPLAVALDKGRQAGVEAGQLPAPEVEGHHEAQEGRREKADQQARERYVSAPQEAGQTARQPADNPAGGKPSKAKFDKNTYQRELMRKRRAKAKAGQQA
jgi:hypothetical protein